MNFDSLRNKFEKLRKDWAEDSAVDFQLRTNNIVLIWDSLH